MDNELDVVHVDNVLLEFCVDTRQQLCILICYVDRWQLASKLASGKHQRPETVISTTVQLVGITHSSLDRSPRVNHWNTLGWMSHLSRDQQ